MIKGLIIFMIGLFLMSSLNAQIPVNRYKKEISELSSESDFSNYWQSLYTTDQDSLMTLRSKLEMVYDSISFSIMIRTALMFEIHGEDVYKKPNLVPILNVAHNKIAQTNLTFWPIIESCKAFGGVIEQLGGGYPAYQLESLANNFYSYSLVGQDDKYSLLVSKLTRRPKDNIVGALIEQYENQKAMRQLNQIDLIGSWYTQFFSNMREDFCFSFLTLSDGQLYRKEGQYFQILDIIKQTDDSILYRLKHEPFGWYYKLTKEGSLSLHNEKDEVLIAYSSCK